MIQSFSMFEGTGYSVEKRNLQRDAPTAFAEGTLLLHSEVVVGDDAEYLEVWLAVPAGSESVQAHDISGDLGTLSLDAEETE